VMRLTLAADPIITAHENDPALTLRRLSVLLSAGEVWAARTKHASNN
jgi:hypothetical protein